MRVNAERCADACAVVAAAAAPNSVPRDRYPVFHRGAGV
ncbi:putative transposase [Mycobacterium xenopi 4042]|uniref:Putative transposase n=1 Tax=Mycobacterium xenopi 4042 TaxID=1299334 RepID=X8DD31_MYCXE|nr:putative transposase [Mycobacterium xenopi 4042]